MALNAYLQCPAHSVICLYTLERCDEILGPRVQCTEVLFMKLFATGQIFRFSDRSVRFMLAYRIDKLSRVSAQKLIGSSH